MLVRAADVRGFMAFHRHMLFVAPTSYRVFATEAAAGPLSQA